MKARTGLHTVDGVMRHCPWVTFTYEECQLLQQWLPQGGTDSDELYRVMKEAQEKADVLNARLDADQAHWKAKKQEWGI